MVISHCNFYQFEATRAAITVMVEDRSDLLSRSRDLWIVQSGRLPNLCGSPMLNKDQSLEVSDNESLIVAM